MRIDIISCSTLKHEFHVGNKPRSPYRKVFPEKKFS